MKKILALLLALVLTLGLAACGGSGSAPAPEATAAPAPASEPTPTPEPTPEPPVPFLDTIGDWGGYDELVAAIREETDSETRAGLIRQAEDALMTGFAVLPVYHTNRVFLQKEYVRGVITGPTGARYYMYVTPNGDAKTPLRLSLIEEPDRLDPARIRTAGDISLVSNVFSGLYGYHENGEIVPVLAEDLQISEDGLTVTVTLRRGLLWSDGNPLTAADFVYAWKRAADPATGAAYGYLLNILDGYGTEAGVHVTAQDDATLVFVLREPCADLTARLAFPVFFPVRQSEVESAEDGDWAGKAGFVSCGPYVCTGWERGASMTFEKNLRWYDADNMGVRTLLYTRYADEYAAFNAYRDGALDLTDSVPAFEIQYLLDSPELRVEPASGTSFLAFNVGSALFEDKTPAEAAAMRQAMCILIDRAYICENVGQTGQPPASGYLPAGMAGIGERSYFDPNAINEDFEGTLERARELLTEAGFRFAGDGTLSEETPLSFSCLTDTNAGHVAIAESVQVDLSMLGIEVGVDQRDPDSFREGIAAGEYDLVQSEIYAPVSDPLALLEIWTTDSEGNLANFGRAAG